MYLDRAQWAMFFPALFLIDIDLADRCRQGGCPWCGGPLHHSDYQRKPRGGLTGLDDEVCLRLSLCCGREGCRRRTLPPSCRFLGRKVYFAAVVLVVVTMRQRRPSSASAAKLRAAFGVSWETVSRWMTFFDEVFPATTTWKRLRGSVPAGVGNDDLPAGLLEVMVAQAGDRCEGLTRCLRLLSPCQKLDEEHGR
jgi:hypothetical protein